MRKIIEIFGGHPKVSGYTLYPENGKYEVNIDGDDDPKELGFPAEIEGIPVEYTHHKIHLTSQWWERPKFTDLENRTRVLDDPSIPVQEPNTLDLAIRTAQDPIYGGCEISQETDLNRWGGTFSCIVWDRTTHQPLLLGSAHILCPNRFQAVSNNTNFFPPEDVGTPI